MIFDAQYFSLPLRFLCDHRQQHCRCKIRRPLTARKVLTGTQTVLNVATTCFHLILNLSSRDTSSSLAYRWHQRSRRPLANPVVSFSFFRETKLSGWSHDSQQQRPTNTVKISHSSCASCNWHLISVRTEEQVVLWAMPAWWSAATTCGRTDKTTEEHLQTDTPNPISQTRVDMLRCGQWPVTSQITVSVTGHFNYESSNPYNYIYVKIILTGARPAPSCPFPSWLRSCSVRAVTGKIE